MKDKHFIWQACVAVIGLWLITACSGEQTPTPTPTPTAAPTVAGFVTPGTGTATPACQPSSPPGWGAYIIQPGDTLLDLAAGRGVTVEQVRRANCLPSNVLVAGTSIYLPLLPTPTPCRIEIPAGWALYQVQTGDTLFSLAEARQTTVAEIEQVNCLAAEAMLAIGQTLHLPLLPTPTPTSTPLPPPPPPTPRPTPTFPLVMPTPGIVSLPTMPPVQTLGQQNGSLNQPAANQAQTDNTNQPLTDQPGDMNPPQTGPAANPTTSPRASLPPEGNIQLRPRLPIEDTPIGKITYLSGLMDGFDHYYTICPSAFLEDSSADVIPAPVPFIRAIHTDDGQVVVCLIAIYPVNEPITVEFYSGDKRLLSGTFHIEEVKENDFWVVWSDPPSINNKKIEAGLVQVNDQLKIITLSFGWSANLLPDNTWLIRASVWYCDLPCTNNDSYSDFLESDNFYPFAMSGKFYNFNPSSPYISPILESSRVYPTDVSSCVLLTPDEVKSPLKIKGVNFPYPTDIPVGIYRRPAGSMEDYQRIDSQSQIVPIDSAGILSTTFSIDPADTTNQYIISAVKDPSKPDKTIESFCFRVVTPESTASMPGGLIPGDDNLLAQQKLTAVPEDSSRIAKVSLGGAETADEPVRAVPISAQTAAEEPLVVGGSYYLLLILGLLVVAGIGGWLWVSRRRSKGM